MKMKNVPNILSVIRLIMVPLFVWLFLDVDITAGIIVFVVAGATDVVDGYIARKYNCTSTAGKVLDPLADKFLQLSAFVCLWLKGFVPWWMPFIYFVKELATALGALFIFRKANFVIKSNLFGKLATLFVFVAVFVIALFHKYIGYIGASIICALVALFFVVSIGVYCKDDFIKVVKASKKNKEKDSKPE